MVMKMEWTRTETLVMANDACAYCAGYGQVKNTRGSRPCACVFRSIFKSCYKRFRECVENAPYVSRARLEFVPGKDSRRAWSFKNEEFIADFTLIAKRTLSPSQYTIFKYHYLLGADWQLCTRKLKMDRGEFFHHVYRIQTKLGRAFRETEPYALFPLDEYFASTPRERDGGPNRSVKAATPAKPRINVPLKQAA
jgi:hypothetical protein